MRFRLMGTVTVLVWVCGLANPVWADAPRVVKSIPADGATQVSPDLDQIEILFDRNMKMNSYSVLEVTDAPFPPLRPDDGPWETPIRFVLKVTHLKPNTTYGVQLNSAKKTGFQSAEDQIPLPPTPIRFTTGAVGTAAQPAPSVAEAPTSTGRVSGGEGGQPLLLDFGSSSAAPAPPSTIVAPSAPSPVQPMPPETTQVPRTAVPTWPMSQQGPAPLPSGLSPHSGGGAAEANQILDRMDATLTQMRSLTATIGSTLSMGGQTINAQGQYASDLARNAFVMQTTAQTMQGPMVSKMVCDGQNVWQELSMGGHTLAQKASLAAMQQMNGGASPNPIVGARMLRQQFDFSQASQGTARDGSAVYVLEGSYKPAHRQRVEQLIQQLERQNPQIAMQLRQQLGLINSIRFQVGSQDFLPRAQEMLDAQGQTVMGVYLSAITPNPAVSPTLFQYQPPPGVPVTDLNGQMGQPNQP